MSHSINRATAGYRMLMILSAVDGSFNSKEDRIIRNYMKENYKESINYDNEMEIISALEYNDYAIHFNDAMNSFYMQSSQSERNHFLDMATKLVVADKKISPRENLYLKELYNAWEEEIED